MKDHAVIHYLQTTLKKLDRAGCYALNKGQLNKAMAAVSAAAQLLYTANIRYTEESFENLLAQIAAQLPSPISGKPVAGRILFYDGFGLNNRGLIQIYLKALVKLGEVIYVTHSSRKEYLPDVLKVLDEHGGKALWLTQHTHADTARELCDIFSQYTPAHSFLYTVPDDVAALAAFQRNIGQTHRYQINLTDHAYWLGTSAFDTCIEFRDYGASISREGRLIPQEKLVKLPFYPAINPDIQFQGYPFEVPQGAKIVFSGGALYKTLGGDNRYYKLVDFILKEFPEAIFWYAGSGDATQLDILIAAYPGRIFHTAERPDLVQVLQHSFLYLSTYPLCGGLMFQYAASAGKVPVTLRYDDVSDDFLLDQESLGIQFETLEQTQEELRRLFRDPDYLKEKERRVKAAVLTQVDFETGLALLIQSGNSGYPIHFKCTDTSKFRSEYLNNLTKPQLDQRLAVKRNISLLSCIPLSFLRGTAVKLKSKLEAKWK